MRILVNDIYVKLSPRQYPFIIYSGNLLLILPIHVSPRSMLIFDDNDGLGHRCPPFNPDD